MKIMLLLMIFSVHFHTPSYIGKSKEFLFHQFLLLGIFLDAVGEDSIYKTSFSSLASDNIRVHNDNNYKMKLYENISLDDSNKTHAPSDGF